MNPQSHETGLNLPPPVTGEQGPLTLPSEAPKSGVEQGIQGLEQAPNPNQASGPSMTISPLPMMPAMPQSAAQTDVPATSTSSSTSVVDDQDLIEKEWVNKAKQIVERTRDDPHKQSEELSGVKAEYMKKRYDKNIKVST